jgi:hypothetical protein
LLHLPTDEYVLKNLKRKRELQAVSMGLMMEEIRKEQEDQTTIEIR